MKNTSRKNKSSMATTEYTRNGITVLRVKHSNIKKSSDNMKDNRKKFAARQAILTKFADSYKIGFDQLKQQGQTAYNAGVSFNTSHAVNDGVVDMNMLQMSQGPLPGVRITRCEIVDQKLVVEWDSEMTPALGADDAIVATVAKEKMDIRPFMVMHDGLRRKHGRLVRELDRNWLSDSIYVYLFAFRSEINACSNTSCAKIDR